VLKPARDRATPSEPTLKHVESDRAPALPERYRVERELGRGGMGRVFAARDEKLGRDVAIKVLAVGNGDEQTLRRFEQEARAAALLEHPNIVAVYDIGQHESGPYIVSELLRGETLRDRMAGKPLRVEDALDYATQLAMGLTAAHDKGVIHRDLKPENLFITRDGRLKILDFGIAKLVTQPGTTLTKSGTIMGTVGYMAPEQVRSGDVDVRSDIFSFGSVLHEMLSGTQPFARGSTMETGAAILNDAPFGLPNQVPDKVSVIVQRCLQKRREDRYQSAQELAADLARIAAGQTARKSPLLRILGVVLLLAVSVLTAALLGLAWQLLPNRLSLLLGAFAMAGALGTLAWLLFSRRSHGPSGPAASVTPSIAVLPFADMSPQHDQEYFADGIAEEILNVLAQVDGLRVIGRTSSFSMKGRNEDLRTIGQRLGATNLLEGSVRKSGARVRITAQLVEAEGGSHIWSQEFDRELTDVFAVQEEIAHAVVAAFKVKLLPAAREDPRAANPEAYDLYLLGRAFRARGSGDAYERAVQALRRSVALDPGYAQAWAELAQALYDVGDFSVKGDRKADRPEGLVAAEKAIALAPERADGYSARGVLRHRMLQDWTGARADLERARSLNPRSPGILLNYAMLLSALGGLTEVIAICQQAAVLDPLSADIQYLLNTAYLGTGQFALAEAAASRALEVSPEHARAARNLGITLLLQNRGSDARAAFHRSNHEFVVSMGDVMVEHTLGHSAESQRALDSILAGPYAEVAAYQIVQMYAWRGETDRAFAWLGRAAELHDAGLTYLKFDPLLHGLRGDARFAALLKKMNLPTD
jgi:eukaryotic-like serine/threonine-protein kinase